MLEGEPEGDYQTLLIHRGLIRGWRPVEESFTSQALLYREERLHHRLRGWRCPGCGATLTLKVSVCGNCQARGPFEEVKLSTFGRVFTFTHEYLLPSPAPPTAMAVVDLDGGGRLTLQMTDTHPESVQIGMPVRLSLRRLHLSGGIIHYYWKARPLWEGEKSASGRTAPALPEGFSGRGPSPGGDP
jgi:uncharacterized OB-fold protein